MDYRELLIKYIQHVGEEEGSVFLPIDEFTHSKVEFSKEEREELDMLNEESYDRSEVEDK